MQEEILHLHDSGLFPEAAPIFLLDVSEETLATQITLTQVSYHRPLKAEI